MNLQNASPSDKVAFDSPDSALSPRPDKLPNMLVISKRSENPKLSDPAHEGQ